MKPAVLRGPVTWLLVVLSMCSLAGADSSTSSGAASWYGEAHRGKLMANGQPFDPDKLTAASWAFPLGTKLRVTASEPQHNDKTVVVTVTDRGPARRLVEQGRIIDLSRAAFLKLAPPDAGLVHVMVEPAPE